MSKSVRRTILIAFTSMPLAWAASVFAASIASGPPETSISKNGWSAVIDAINLARNWIFGILLAIVVVFILIGAFQILTAGGDDNKVKKGKNVIRNAVIALVIGVLCGSIVLLVTSFFDAATGSNPPNDSTGGNIGSPCTANVDCKLGLVCLPQNPTNITSPLVCQSPAP